MFIIEKFISDFRAKEDAWERARDKWLDQATEYDYRSERDYCEKHPRPADKIKVVGRGVVIAFVVVGISFLLAGFIREIIVSNRNKPKEVVQNQKNCQKFNKEDHVRVQYGDYADQTGRIIGGCENGQPYQVKLDDGQKASVPNDGIAEQVDVGGRTIGVDNENNLVVIEDKKE